MTLKSWIDWNNISDAMIRKFQTNAHYNNSVYMESIVEKVKNKSKYAGLEYEAKTYRFVTDNIIVKNLSNNFIPLISFGKCNLKDIVNELDKSVLTSDDKDALHKKFADPVKDFPSLKLNIMVTGSITNRDNLPAIGDYLDSHDIPLYETNSIIFQLLHALYVMEQLKLMQNDLHFGNILLEILPEAKIITITISPKVSVQFRTRYIPKIFDWDRAYCESLGPNPILTSERYARLNSFNTFKKSADYYQLICELINSEYVDNIKTILNDILPNNNFNSWNTTKTKSSSNVDFILSSGDTAKVLQYIKSSPKVNTINNNTYLNLSKKQFESVIPLPVIKEKFNSEQYDRYNVTDQVYVSFSPSGTLTIYAGWHCMPYYNVPDSLLVPLKTLFDTNQKLFHNLTKNLMNFSME